MVSPLAMTTLSWLGGTGVANSSPLDFPLMQLSCIYIRALGDYGVPEGGLGTGRVTSSRASRFSKHE